MYDFVMESFPQLENCPNLQTISLVKIRDLGIVLLEGFKQLEKLILSDSDVTEVTLNQCPNLQELNLEYTRHLKTVSLNGLQNLKKLYLSFSTVEKLTGLQESPNLEFIALRGVNLDKLKLSLQGFKKLKNVLVSNGSTDLTKLKLDEEFLNQINNSYYLYYYR
jgi:Leucine-rich repeat (LRR) protein